MGKSKYDTIHREEKQRKNRRKLLMMREKEGTIVHVWLVGVSVTTTITRQMKEALPADTRIHEHTRTHTRTHTR